jgi:hypothetical protein
LQVEDFFVAVPVIVTCWPACTVLGMFPLIVTLLTFEQSYSANCFAGGRSIRSGSSQQLPETDGASMLLVPSCSDACMRV